MSENLSIIPPLNKIVNIMRDELKLTYKRCLSQPNSIDLDRIKLLRCLLPINFTSHLNQSTLIWSIDEYTFSWSTKQNTLGALKVKKVQNSPLFINIYMILAKTQMDDSYD